MRYAVEDQEAQFARAFAALRDAIAQCSLPGAALAVTYRGALIASQGFGRFTYDPASPEIHAVTIFDLASVTKVVATTSMAMLLFDRGQLDLAAPVADLLPEFGHVGDRSRVTLRMLLAHSSGLPSYVKLFETACTRDGLVRRACSTPLIATPGAKAEYSDIGFILLGEVLARLAREPLDTFTHREVFAPLGMANTCFNPRPECRDVIPPTEDDRIVPPSHYSGRGQR